MNHESIAALCTKRSIMCLLYQDFCFGKIAFARCVLSASVAKIAVIFIIYLLNFFNYVIEIMFTSINSPCLCVAGEAGFYPKVMSVCSALSRYLLSLPKLPSALQILPATEHLITSFTTLVTEVHVHTPIIAFRCPVNGRP